MPRRTIEPVTLGRTVPLQRTREGVPLLVAMPARVACMEGAAADLFERLAALTVAELQALRPSGPYIALVDALIRVRELMGGEGSQTHG